MSDLSTAKDRLLIEKTLHAIRLLWMVYEDDEEASDGYVNPVEKRRTEAWLYALTIEDVIQTLGVTESQRGSIPLIKGRETK